MLLEEIQDFVKIPKWMKKNQQKKSQGVFVKKNKKDPKASTNSQDLRQNAKVGSSDTTGDLRTRFVYKQLHVKWTSK